MDILPRKYIRMAVVVLLIAACFPLFLHLDSQPLHLYDESRLANNALEMTQTGDLIVTYYDGEPDMWNTKPPLMIWLQALCMKLFGYNELAVRLPAALAGLGTVILLLWFLFRLQRPLAGVISALVLVSTAGFAGYHVTRTGDYDALLVLWLTAGLFFFFLFTQSDPSRDRKKYLFLTTACIVLAVLTKSIAGLMFLPAWLLFLIWEKQLVRTLRSVSFWVALLMGTAAIAGYYLLRENLNPGYLEAVFHNELGGRYFHTLEENYRGIFYYIMRVGNRFGYWLFLLPWIGLFYGSETEGVRKLVRLLILTCTFYFTVISFSQTKLPWYDAPLYPALAVIAGVSLERTFLLLTPHFDRGKPIFRFLFLGLFLATFLYLPYAQRIRAALTPHAEQYKKRQYGTFMKKLEEYPRYSVAYEGYNSVIQFYAKTAKLRGLKVFTGPPEGYRAGTKVMVCEADIFKKMQERFHFTELERWQDCLLVEIQGTK